jgi:hypothetical protein
MRGAATLAGVPARSVGRGGRSTAPCARPPIPASVAALPQLARRLAGRLRFAVVAAVMVLLVPALGLAQDFSSASPPGPADSPCAMIERGLPPALAVAGTEASFTRWLGLPGLETRAVACAAGLGIVRVAAGFSQTGEADYGWNSAALAFGMARREGGAAFRVVARRDRTIESGSEAAARLEARAGLETGGGAWLEATEGLKLWASVPQAWAGGVAPPLDRPLELGARGELGIPGGRDGLAFWLTRGSPSRNLPADHGAGVALRSGPITAWGTVRDRPLRGGFGLAARARWLSVAAEVESHPDLGETVRLSLGLIGASR